MKQTCLFLVIVAAGLTFLNCSPSTKQWYKSGATAKQFERDKVDCEDSFLETATTGSQKELYTFESCMENKGWIILDKAPL